MKFVRQVVVGFVVLLALASSAHAQGSFPLRNGDCVIFYGDSITDQRLYTTFVESYVVTRFPRLNVRFIHSGWGGDRVSGGGGGPIDVRLRRDVIAYKPTVMTIMLGMNDGGVRPFDQELYDKFTSGYENIIKTVKAAVPGIRIVVIEPSPYDDVTRPAGFPGGYNSVLVRYGQFLRAMAQRESLTVADLNSPVVAALEKAQTVDPKIAQMIVPDRVHPGPGGHLIMAEALLKAWKAPAQVSSVEIDAAGKRVVRAENAAVTGLNADASLTWTQTDKALPMPLEWKDKVLALSVQSSDVVEALDKQPLKVTGLTADRYALKIDGEDVGVFTRPQLEAGVNLAVLPTPMAKQALSVHELTLRHNQIHYARWRELEVPLANQSYPKLQPAMAALDKLEAEIIAKQRATAQPKPRKYQLTPQ
jgi:lysophospholipase L1-like esterase